MFPLKLVKIDIFDNVSKIMKKIMHDNNLKIYFTKLVNQYWGAKT